MKEKLLRDCQKKEKLNTVLGILVFTIYPFLYIIFMVVSIFLMHYKTPVEKFISITTITSATLLTSFMVLFIVYIILYISNTRLLYFCSALVCEDKYSIFMTYKKLKKIRMINSSYRKLEKEIEVFINGI
ncbi:hypothetical protein AB5V95_02985 [Metamycoplasma spumans]|uniref:hypothetical protein n=1 Tax=Metamycoplasma spumans TaxID=92406 RepID=UPI0034DCF41F